MYYISYNIAVVRHRVMGHFKPIDVFWFGRFFFQIAFLIHFAYPVPVDSLVCESWA